MKVLNKSYVYTKGKKYVIEIIDTFQTTIPYEFDRKIGREKINT